jgi:Zn-dependent peptidase ImmA (M78 family)
LTQLEHILLGRQKIKVKYEILQNLYGYYDPNKHLLVIDKRLKGLKLFNTIMHELFHIIINFSDINVNKRGEEPIAQAVGDGYEKVFKQNPKLWTLLTKLLK